MPARDGNGASSGCWRRCRVGRLVAKRERESGKGERNKMLVGNEEKEGK